MEWGSRSLQAAADFVIPGKDPSAVAEFIAVQRAEFGVPHVVACRALGVSQAWFYKWRYGDGSPRRARPVSQLAIAIVCA